MKVLIPTMPDDGHAINVKLALDKLGHECVLWHTADFPTQQNQTFEISMDGFHWYVEGTNINISNDSFDVIWNRRPRKPILSDDLHPDDIENATKENTAFFQFMWHVIGDGSRWINSYNEGNSGNSKLLQLKTAANVGLNIPETLVSNDPKLINQFIDKYKNDEVVYKTVYPVAWFDDKSVRLTYTKPISKSDLPSDDTLKNTPGIFQRKVEKAYELRVVYMGGEFITVKLDSQSDMKSKEDWRAAPTTELNIEQVELPENISNKCVDFMNSLGLEFGSFDFIVTPENEYYFLEVNEQGQFLWLEDINPEIKILDAFIQFITCTEDKFTLKKSYKPLSLCDFRDEAYSYRTKLTEKHVDIGPYK